MKLRMMIQGVMIIFLLVFLIACSSAENKGGGQPFIEDPIGEPIEGLIDDPLEHHVDKLDKGKIDEQQQGDEHKSEEKEASVEEDYTCADATAAKGEAAIAFLQANQLCKGIVEGLEVQIGDAKTEMRDKLGKPEESGYFDGGYYDAYDIKHHRVLFFGEEDGVIEHIWLVPYDRIPLQMVCDLLGAADYERLTNGNDGETDEDIFVLYDYDDYTFRVIVEEESMHVSYFFLKSEHIATP